MKTQLPIAISTVAEAEAFLRELHANGEAFHPADDANNIDWRDAQISPKEGTKLNFLIEQIYDLPGNDGRHYEPLIFDPCVFLTDLEVYQTYLRDNNLADDSDTISAADLRSFVSEQIEPKEEEYEEGDMSSNKFLAMITDESAYAYNALEEIVSGSALVEEVQANIESMIDSLRKAYDAIDRLNLDGETRLR